MSNQGSGQTSPTTPTVKHYKDLRHLKLTVNRPGIAYGLACGAYCSVCVLFMLCILALGTAFLPFVTEVPLYLRNHPTKQRIDAIEAGKLEANAEIQTPPIQLTQSENTDGSGILINLELLYEPSGGDVWAVERVKRMMELEKEVLNWEDYDKYCLRAWPEERREQVATTTVDEVKAWNQNLPPCLPPVSGAWSCASGDCNNIASFPPGVLQCNTAQCTSTDDMTVDQQFIRHKLVQYSEVADPTAAPLSVTAFRLLIADSRFGGGSTLGRAARTEFRFALPLQGYDTVKDRYDEQITEVEEWLTDKINPMFEFGNDDMNVWFTGYGLQEAYIVRELPGSLFWAAFSFLFVFHYILILKRSWWYAIMGMGQIVLSFAPAYFLYFVVFQQRYFGVFNLLSIFIILGIGADDIFVILDTWDQSESGLLEHGCEITQLSKFSITWKRAARAMAVTSSTTMASFLANAGSSFPAISTFGIFTAMLVLVNYCAVCLYFPTVISMYDRYFARKKFCCGAFTRCGDALSAKKLFKNKGEWEDDRDWWADVFADKFIIRLRIPILLVITAGLIVCGIFAAKLEPDPNPPKFFPEGNNFNEINPKKAEYYARGGSVFSLKQRLVFGINPDTPIDRSGTRATNETDYGKPIWVGFSWAKTADCMIAITKNAEEFSEHRKTGGPPEFVADFPLIPFKAWAQSTLGSQVNCAWANITSRETDEAFGACLATWLVGYSTPQGESNYAAYKHLVWAQQDDNAAGSIPAIPRFLMAQLSLTVEFTYNPDDGMALYDIWEQWMDDVWKLPECSQWNRNTLPFYHITENPGFDYFFVQDVLFSEAINGIGLSLLLAFIILTLATHNIVLGVVSTLVIFMIVGCVIGFSVMIGWKLGMLEGVIFVMVPGLSVDYCAHLAEGYNVAHATDRRGRVRSMLSHVGVSVVSGAFSTLGASAFLFFPTIDFFRKFGIGMFATIGFSLAIALFYLSAFLALLGPQGNTGDLLYLLTMCKRKITGEPEPHKEGAHDLRETQATPVEPPQRMESTTELPLQSTTVNGKAAGVAEGSIPGQTAGDGAV